MARVKWRWRKQCISLRLKATAGKIGRPNVTVARVRTEKKNGRFNKTHGSKMIQNSANRKLNVRPIKKDVDSNLTRPKRSEEVQ